MKSLRKALFIKTSNRTFIEQDQEFIREYCPDTVIFHYHGKSLLDNLVSQVKLFWFLMRNSLSANFIFIWFCDYHALLPALFSKIFRIPMFIVLGGYDAVVIPEINYGAHGNPLRRTIIRIAANCASRLLPVSEFTLNQFLFRTNEKYRKKMRLVHNAVKQEVYYRDNSIEKEPYIITVNATTDPSKVILKGTDIFIRVAEELPEYQFAIIGLDGKAKQQLSEIPANINIIPYLSRDELVKEYSRAAVICQLSLTESFGLALAEGMACECIPIGSNRGGLPEVIGKAGFLVDTENYKQIQKSIVSAIENTDKMGSLARKRITSFFSLEKRKERLIRIIQSFPMD